MFWTSTVMHLGWNSSSLSLPSLSPFLPFFLRLRTHLIWSPISLSYRKCLYYYFWTLLSCFYFLFFISGTCVDVKLPYDFSKNILTSTGLFYILEIHFTSFCKTLIFKDICSNIYNILIFKSLFVLFDSPCLLFSCFTNAVASGIFFLEMIYF